MMFESQYRRKALHQLYEPKKKKNLTPLRQLEKKRTRFSDLCAIIMSKRHSH
ncbi:hypothetical protein [Bacillus kexueae]|uniref:hypothetical protein n=1 Tax=Aeribacillus kexueae TaxID=2078952 RepID=UPI001FAFAA4D|nr:hypothetical protein [Bacillus kexueae]